jgi:hypothetical protein
VVAVGGSVGGTAGREEEIAVEAMKGGVEERLARLCRPQVLGVELLRERRRADEIASVAGRSFRKRER